MAAGNLGGDLTLLNHVLEVAPPEAVPSTGTGEPLGGGVVSVGFTTGGSDWSGAQGCHDRIGRNGKRSACGRWFRGDRRRGDKRVRGKASGPFPLSTAEEQKPSQNDDVERHDEGGHLERGLAFWPVAPEGSLGEPTDWEYHGFRAPVMARSVDDVCRCDWAPGWTSIHPGAREKPA